MMEGNDAGVFRTGGRAPGDALIGRLLGDLRIPLLLLAADLCAPVEPRVVKLLHLLDAFHELGEGFELGPLVVGRAYRHMNFYRFRYAAHTEFLRRVFNLWATRPLHTVSPLL